MPTAGHDYGIAKILRSKGLTYKDIADQTGIPCATLTRYAIRHEWDTERDKAVALVTSAVTKDMTTFAQAHVAKIVSFGSAALDNLIKRGFKMSLNDLQTLANVANTFDTLVRRSARMDETKTNNGNTLISVTINSANGQIETCSPIIDLDPVNMGQNVVCNSAK